ncbi:uncharacterized protein [Nicotiana tomentosiformis]|uniref:uncharacterized protein n=1 Tax=Nicotiana tomentosiformis TaxID=4098 RepID=UPI00388CEBF7
MLRQGTRAIVLAPVAPPHARLVRGGGQEARGGGQPMRGGGKPARGIFMHFQLDPRGIGQNGGVQPHFYAFPARSEAESFDAVIICIVLVFHRDASVLFDMGSTYSYVSSYFGLYLNVSRDSLSALVYVSTYVRDSIMVDRVYRLFLVSIRDCETRVDLFILSMVEFDVMLGMDWLSPYHAILDCHAKTVTLATLGFPRLQWRGTPGHSTSMDISYVNARRMIKKGCLVYFVDIYDPSAEVSSMDSVPVMRKFPEVFPTNFVGMPPDLDIDFFKFYGFSIGVSYIDLVLGTQPISTAPYCMAPVELKELKEQL